MRQARRCPEERTKKKPDPPVADPGKGPITNIETNQTEGRPDIEKVIMNVG